MTGNIKIKGVIFDHDGTLVDSESVHAKLWTGIMRGYGIAFTEEEYFREHKGMPTETNAEKLAAKYGLAVSPKELAKQKSSATRRYLEENSFPLMPGMKEVIGRLHGKGIKKAIVTGADRYSVEKTLKTYDLEMYFDAVVSGEEVRNKKPAPDGYILALERLGLAAGECVVIEDSDNGRRSAESAGIKCHVIRDERDIPGLMSRILPQDTAER